MEDPANLPFDYETQKQVITQLYTTYPFLRVRVAGRSALGRALFALQFGNPENAVLCAGSFCGDGESAAALLQFAKALCACIAEETSLCGVEISRPLCSQGIMILPCVNPDGAEINAHGEEGALQLRKFVRENGFQKESPWRADALGAELSFNFPYQFALRREAQNAAGFSRPSAAGFCGETPASQAETRALTRFCRSGRFRRALTLSAAGAEGVRAFAPQTETGAQDASVCAKILADSADLDYSMADPVTASGTFGGWFADSFRQTAFEINAPREDAAALYARVREALVLFSLL